MGAAAAAWLSLCLAAAPRSAWAAGEPTVALSREAAQKALSALDPSAFEQLRSRAGLPAGVRARGGSSGGGALPGGATRWTKLELEDSEGLLGTLQDTVIESGRAASSSEELSFEPADPADEMAMTFAGFVAYLRSVPAAKYAGRPGRRVRDAKQFERVRASLLSRVRGLTGAKTLTADAAGDVTDCVRGPRRVHEPAQGTPWADCPAGAWPLPRWTLSQVTRRMVRLKVGGSPR